MSIEIKVTRGSAKGKSRMGTFTAGNVSGVTLENDAKKINTGTYSAQLYDSPKFKRKVVLLENKDGRTYIEIHAGNYVSQTVGCILVGTSAGVSGGDGAVWNSSDKLNELVKACEGKSITVIVK
mmetsp:Transcript_6587/g.13052  ORF Transcript_6587/g.13052 Transcript_6587/m.13052 type:complete len:124 (-) Transcript_6587:92-463(-)